MGSETAKVSTNSVNHNHPLAAHPEIVDRDKGLVTRGREKVAIVGFAASSRMMAPFDDATYEIWGLNQGYRHIPRADRWFDIHYNWDEHVVEGTDHLGWLAAAPIPIYMTKRIEGIPNSIRFPIEEVMEGHLDYFTSTVAFEIALAIKEGFKEIALYGIDLIVEQEYDYQKACAEFWLGVAHGKGIKITLPQTSALCKASHRYGYELEPDSLVRMSELVRRKQGLLDERHKKMIELANLDGALQDCQMWHDLADLRNKGGMVDV
jgi:hypothetical protein